MLKVGDELEATGNFSLCAEHSTPENQVSRVGINFSIGDRASVTRIVLGDGAIHPAHGLSRAYLRLLFSTAFCRRILSNCLAASFTS